MVSASPEYYLLEVLNILPFDHVIGTKTTKDFVMTGKNNRQEEKVRRILLFLEEENMKIDYDNSCTFSDSYTADHYMMELTKNRYLINSSHQKEGYHHFTWHL